MGIFNLFRNKLNSLSPEQLKELLSILEDGKSCGLDLGEFSNKVKNVLENKNEKIRVVLVGSFSDGKTSVVAGLIGQVLSNMKIDLDESSDELTFYRPTQIGDAIYEFVDTPGLFGRKERELDGKDIKLSNITLKYMSEAQIIMYVCDAVTPLKDSHKNIIRRILRDFGKLRNTIFVINRFDETGCEMSDDVEYTKLAKIKRDGFIQRLREIIDLTSEEEKDLKIACIAANPNNKGMEYWLNNKSYNSYSHINEVKTLVLKIIGNADKKQLMAEANYSVMKDVTIQIQAALDSSIISLQSAMKKERSLVDSCEDDCNSLRRDLNENLGNMRKQLVALKDKTLNSIDNASIDTIGEIMNHLGIENEQLTLYSLIGEIDQIIRNCVDCNTQCVETKIESINLNFSRQDEFMRDIASKGAGLLTKVSIDGANVKAVRDMFFSSYKFKPWGAIKMGEKITKVTGVIGTTITIISGIWDLYKKKKMQEEFGKVQKKLKDVINSIFSELENKFKDDNEFYSNFAPSYLHLQSTLEQRKEELERIDDILEKSEAYSSRLKKWMRKAQIEDVEFEDVN